MQVYCAIPVPMAAIGLFVGIYLLTLPDGTADSYGVDDYAAPVEPVREQPARRLRPQPDRPAVGRAAVDILPPAPPGMDAGVPMYRQLTAQLGGEPHDVFTARQWLRELAAEARMEMAR
jgi:hypothetical protein